jgi:hypothetical protein
MRRARDTCLRALQTRGAVTTRPRVGATEAIGCSSLFLAVPESCHVQRSAYYRFASTQASHTAICLPLGSGSARVQPSAESVKTSFGGDVSKPPTRVALMHTAFPLCGFAGQFAFEQVQLSIGMLSGPFPGGNPTGRSRSAFCFPLYARDALHAWTLAVISDLKTDSLRHTLGARPDGQTGFRASGLAILHQAIEIGHLF